MSRAPSCNPAPESRGRLAVAAMTLLLVAAHAVPLWLGWRFGWPWALGGLALVALVLTACTVYPHSVVFGRPLRGVGGGERRVVITIDDGPTADTDALLEILAARRVRALFFLVGDLSARHPDRVRRILAAGHVVGNHTQTHNGYWFWCFPPWRMRWEIDECQRTLTALIGTAPTLFRAPAGMRNPYCNLLAAAAGLAVIGWRARGFDGVATPVDRVVELVRRGLRPGGIVLLHQGMPHSLEAVDRVLDMLARDGWDTMLPDEWITPAAGGTLPANC